MAGRYLGQGTSSMFIKKCYNYNHIKDYNKNDRTFHREIKIFCVHSLDLYKSLPYTVK